ncbi:hypothetical protein [Comamonas sp. NLF-1-9]|uniref:hypothetical protein n=1 Tax=Comamonas sp. NLF-1-9 TaxID=2853163 RepID=UPI001C494D49|nr:hypothetical protein [Comamonas sp. NLF-1-9]QXL83825.1 hypothetical protein KUD94_11300 [Comamonas sp. NLF-1-9]
MDTPGWVDVASALVALVVSVLPLLLARWLILRRQDGDTDSHEPPSTLPSDTAPPRARHVHSSRTRSRP